jgi:2-methylisocitrate lyase-like PEP mutase family enzyme
LEHAEQPTPESAVVDGAGETDARAAFDARRRAFRALHEEGCFVIPNPWDVGSARYLQHLGFPALATTSAGFAFSRGLPDSDAAVGLERSLSHIAEIAAAVDLPVNADIAALGVRRVSVGGALALAAWGGLMRAAQGLKSEGSFAGLAGLAPYSDVNDFLAADLRLRGI